MKYSHEVRLGLEVLEDRLAPNGAFGGAINVGAPTLNPFLVMTGQPANAGQLGPGFRGSFGDFNSAPPGQASSFQSQLQSFQSQFQSFQASQIAMIDQLFGQLESALQHLTVIAL